METVDPAGPFITYIICTSRRDRHPPRLAVARRASMMGYDVTGYRRAAYRRDKTSLA
jgi:hypothetical protein